MSINQDGPAQGRVTEVEMRGSTKYGEVPREESVLYGQNFDQMQMDREESEVQEIRRPSQNLPAIATANLY